MHLVGGARGLDVICSEIGLVLLVHEGADLRVGGACGQRLACWCRVRGERFELVVRGGS